MARVFSLGFDLRRVMLMTTGACWSFAVIGLYMALISWRVSGFSFDTALTPDQLNQSWRVLTSTRATPDRVLLWLGVIGLWWLGFARIITPVFRSLALEVSRDDRLDQKGMAVASHRLSGLVTGGPLVSLLLAGVFFGCVVIWALLAKIPTAAGSIIAALVLPLAIIAALVAASVLLVTLISLPLMTPAAVIECRDLMDVVSRAAAYVLQRPFRYLLGLLAKLGITLAALIAGCAVFLLAWALIYLALMIAGEGELALSTYHMIRRSGSVGQAHFFSAVCFSAGFYGSALILLGWLLTIGASADVVLYMVMRYEVDGVTYDEIMLPQEHIEIHGLTADETRKQQQAAQDVAKLQAASGKEAN